MSIFTRVRNLRQNLPQEKAATTLPQDRPLTSEECRLAEHLLCYAGARGAAAFIPQLVRTRVTGQCSCGCPTVDLAAPPDLRVSKPPRERLIADATGRVDGKLVGAMIRQDEGLLTVLEVYRLEDGSDKAFGLPPIETIEKLVWDPPSRPEQ
jgi:hypothetical protein